jgi:hypothetical protein
MAAQYKITKAEVQRLSVEWQKAKHVVVMIDDVSIQFATDVANKVLQDFVQSIAEIQAAKNRAVSTGPVPPPEVKKSSLVLTDL